MNSIDHGSLRNEKEDMEFHHPYFIKDKEQFLEYIKRKVPDIKQNVTTLFPNQTAPQQTQQQQQQQIAQSQNNGSQISIQQLSQFPQIKPDEIKQVLDNVNIIKTKQKIVDDSLFNVKK